MPLENTPQAVEPTQVSAAQVAAPPVESQVSAPIESGDLSQMFSAAQSAAPATPAAETVNAPAAAPTVSALAAQAAQLGIELPATASDAQVASALMTRYQQMAPMAQYAQSLLPHANEINEYFASRGQAPAQPSAPVKSDEWSIDGHFKKHWDEPTLTQEMQFAMNNGMVIRDPETGLMVPKPGMEMMVAPLLQGLNNALNWRTNAARDFIENPYRKTWDALQDPVGRLVEQKVQSIFQAQQAQQQVAMSQQTAADSVNMFEKANDAWIYQAANNGGKLLTPKGNAFVRLVKQMSGSYSGDAGTLLEVCKAAVHGIAQEPVAGAAAQAAVSAPAIAQNTAAQTSAVQKASFLQNAIANASHQPSGGANTVQSPGGPAVVSPMELENMFMNDFRAASSAA